MNENLHKFLLVYLLIFGLPFLSKSQSISSVNGFVYENGRLKSFGLPNGQVVNVKQADNSYKLEYEYHYRDHIGNLRLAFRVKASKKEYKLTGERNVLPKETEDFGENGTTSGGYTTFTRAIAPQPVRTGEFSIRLWVSEMIDGQESRIFKRIPVEAGTKLEMSSFAHYFSPYGSRISQSSPLTQKGGIDASKSKTPPLGAGGLALAELGAAVSVGSTQIGEQKSPQVEFNLFGLMPLAKQVASKLFTAKPKEQPVEETDLGWFNPFMAGMKFTFYDENGNQQYTETIDIGMIRPERWGELLQTFTAPNKGSIEVEIFNYMVNRPVYFDDWHITLTENPKPEIVQEVHYDPWGLVMQEESFFAPPSGAGGLLLFNGKELQTYADLHLYDYHWRQYDPQLGRWHSPDPADQFHGLSGYAYCANNPVMLTDPDGRIVPLIIFAVGVGISAAMGYQAGLAQGASGWGLVGYAVMGAAIGAATGGIGSAVGGAVATGIVGVGTSTLGTMIAHGAISGLVGGAVSGFLSGGMMAGLAGGDVGQGALSGMLWGGVIGGGGRYLYNMWRTAKVPTVEAQKITLTELKGKEAGLNLQVKRPEIDIVVETPSHPVASGGSAAPAPNNYTFQPNTKGMKLVHNDGMIITTSSPNTSVVDRFVYTIYDRHGQLYKFGVSKMDNIRLGQSLTEAGTGATFKATGLMPKYQAHIFEKYLRTLHYNSTGVWDLGQGMQKPFPINFYNGRPLKKP